MIRLAAAGDTNPLSCLRPFSAFNGCLKQWTLEEHLRSLNTSNVGHWCHHRVPTLKIPSSENGKSELGGMQSMCAGWWEVGILSMQMPAFKHRKSTKNPTTYGIQETWKTPAVPMYQNYTYSFLTSCNKILYVCLLILIYRYRLLDCQLCYVNLYKYLCM